MGLDQYAFTLTIRPNAAVDFHETASEPQGFHYWRKHSNLHGWMEALYVRKDGKDPDFNMSPVVIDSNDLDQLERDIRAGALPGTSGFFFGASDGSEQDNDLAFVAKARAAIVEGKTVFYVAWW